MVTIAAAPVALKSLSFADLTYIYGDYKPTRTGINFHLQLKNHRQMARWRLEIRVGTRPFRILLTWS
jgi:hypothetical protein